MFRSLILGAAVVLAPLGAQAVTYQIKSYSYHTYFQPDFTHWAEFYRTSEEVVHELTHSNPENETEAWSWDGPSGDLSGQTFEIDGGWLTFGESNQIIAWNIYGGNLAGYYYRISSEPQEIGGRAAYDWELITAEFDDLLFGTRPGRWFSETISECRADGTPVLMEYCEDTIVAAPVPTSGLLLGSALLLPLLRRIRRFSKS